jgi:hypothetical protein
MKYFFILMVLLTALSFSLNAQIIIPFTVDSNTVALWHFDEGTGNVLYDASFYHNNGNIHNAEWVQGKYGTALHFDGISSVVELVNSNSLKLQDEFTIEAWVSFDTLEFEPMIPPQSPSPVILGNLGPYPYGGGYQLDLTQDAGLRFSYRSGTPISRFSNTYTITSTNRFYHIASVYQRIDSLTIIKLYVDKILVDSSVFAEQIHYTSTPKFFLGTNRDGRAAGSRGVRELPGIIDEVRISKIAKTPSEFTTDYVGVTPSALDFGHVNVGESATLQFTLFNTSTSDTITVQTLSISNNKFSINDTSGIIPPGNELEFGVTYSPLILGVDAGTINIEFTPSNYSDVSIALVGKGITTEVDTNVVALWHFDEGSGNILHDASLYGNDGEIYDGEWVDGKSGSALRFNGFSTFIELANSPSLQLENEFTIEAWVSLDTLEFERMSPPQESSPVILGNLGPYPYGGGYQIDLTSDAGLRFSYRTGGENISRFSNTYPVNTTHRFYHVVSVYKRVDSLTTIKFYVDGLLVDSTVFVEPIHYNSSDKFYFGTNRDGRAAGSWGIRELPGTIDEVKISKVAREPNEFVIASLTPVPSKIDFGFVKVGEVKTREVTLYNTSDSTVITIESIEVTNSMFTVNVSTGPVPPQSSVTFDVTYAPTSLHVDKGIIRFVLSNADVDETTLQLLGKSYNDEIDTNVVALWHFDEGSGNILHDASLFQNDGTIHNAEWVEGQNGSALHFNGVSSFVDIANSASLKQEKEFTIEAWVSFDTLQFEPMDPPHSPSPVILGNLGPYPYGGGYQIDLTQDAELRFSYRTGTPISQFSNTYSITDVYRFYHVASVYQRIDSLTVIKLYVNGFLVDSSVFDEPIHYTATNKFYLGTNIDGRASGSFGVRELPGTLDEIKISRIARDPSTFGLNQLVASKSNLDFGVILLGDTSTEQITVTNTSYTKSFTVNVQGLLHPEISVDQASFELLPRSHQVLTVTYLPTDTLLDSTSFTFTPSDTSINSVIVTVVGEAKVLSEAPIITTINDIPDDQGGQVRIIWLPSKYENSFELLQVEEYSVWRKVEDGIPNEIQNAPEGVPFYMGERQMVLLDDELWDFIVSMPAVDFKKYSFVAPTLYNSTLNTLRLSTFRTAAHATTGEDFFSTPVSGYSLDNIYPAPPQSVNTIIQSDHIQIQWAEVTDIDVSSYSIYRSTRSDFNPLQTSHVGNSTMPEFNDTEVIIGTQYFYAVTTVDASGNESRNAVTTAGITLTEMGTSSISIGEGWNMVSVPRMVPDFSTSAVYPTAVSNAFEYSHGYNNVNTFSLGEGYWMKFHSVQALNLQGYTIPIATIAVSAGWNMLGSISASVPVENITSEPPGIVTSQFFGYSSGYFTSLTIEPGKAYWVKVNQSGTFTLSSEATVSANNAIRIVPTNELPPSPPQGMEHELPTNFALEQNYPNPFNPVTTLRYQLPVSNYVTLKIYNILGQEIRTLVDGVQDAGFKTVEFEASSLPSGLYFYKLQAGTFNKMKKMILMR